MRNEPGMVLTLAAYVSVIALLETFTRLTASGAVAFTMTTLLVVVLAQWLLAFNVNPEVSNGDD